MDLNFQRYLMRFVVLCTISILSSSLLLGIEIEWIIPDGKTTPTKVIVKDVDHAETISEKDLRSLFKIFVIQKDDPTHTDIPVIGNYTSSASIIEFTPRFPLIDRIAYRAVFSQITTSSESKKSIVSIWQHTGPRGKPSTFLMEIYPSSNKVPENLLKFYLIFSNSMSGGYVYQYIHLLDENGDEVELPFLELGQELWDEPMKRLTLFIDPGRIKRGLKPLEDIGPSLVSGHQYKLIIDAEWLDANRLPLVKSFEKVFTVGTPDRTAIDPQKWEKVIPQAGTNAPLVIRFGEAMDHALAQRLIEIYRKNGQPLAGQVSLSNQETEWSFAPSEAWEKGNYFIRIGSILEDLAGNNIGKPFEVDVFDNIQRWITEEYVDLPFNIH